MKLVLFGGLFFIGGAILLLADSLNDSEILMFIGGISMIFSAFIGIIGLFRQDKKD